MEDYIELTPEEATAWIEIQQAKKTLEKHGYYIDNLWQTIDIMENYECTEEQAQKVLHSALTNESTMEQIFLVISFIATDMNLKEKEDEV